MMLKYEALYEVPPYRAWRIAFYNSQDTYLFFGTKEGAKAAGQKLADQLAKKGKYVSNMSIKEVSKYLGK
jgi:ABC-type sugar transport system substrate-binding protein